MLTAHELFGFMSPGLSAEILEDSFQSDRDLYRLTVNAVAEARKLRPAFLERKPRLERHRDIAATLAKPRLDAIAGNLLRSWLMKKHSAMLIEFLDTLGVSHKDGAVDDLPAEIDDAKLRAAMEKILGNHPQEVAAVYLHAFYSMNEVFWPNLKSLLETEPRLQLGG